MKAQVESALENVRPALQHDGGDVELVEVTEEGVVKVRLTGACHGCPMAAMTLQMGIERYLKEQVPEVVSVEAVD
jgi:Fe-S cluster biogenesis protein NfuA